MPNYVGYSPWTDAASYGQGLGQTLGDALIRMPQQRAELAMQAAQQKQAQQNEMAKFALQQQSVNAEQQLGSQRLSLEQQRAEFDKQQKLMELESAKRREAEEQHRFAMEQERLKRGEWQPVQDKATGERFSYNATTGEWKKGELEPEVPAGGMGPMPGVPVGGLGGTPRITPETQNQQNKNMIDITKLYAGAQNSPLTNNPALMNLLSNKVMQVLGAQNAQKGLGAPANPLAGTVTSGLGQAPATNTIGLPPQAVVQTNKILRYNPTTGGIE